MIGPVFQRETATLPRRGRHFVNRVVFAMMLFAIICTTWLLLAGIQPVQNAGDLARFGVLIFQLIAPFQLIVLLFMAALSGSIAVSHEKDNQTLILLPMNGNKCISACTVQRIQNDLGRCQEERCEGLEPVPLT
jgi:hypothetical protein